MDFDLTGTLGYGAYSISIREHAKYERLGEEITPGALASKSGEGFTDMSIPGFAEVLVAQFDSALCSGVTDNDEDPRFANACKFLYLISQVAGVQGAEGQAGIDLEALTEMAKGQVHTRLSEDGVGLRSRMHYIAAEAAALAKTAANAEGLSQPIQVLAAIDGNPEFRNLFARNGSGRSALTELRQEVSAAKRRLGMDTRGYTDMFGSPPDDFGDTRGLGDVIDGGSAMAREDSPIQRMLLEQIANGHLSFLPGDRISAIAYAIARAEGDPFSRARGVSNSLGLQLNESQILSLAQAIANAESGTRAVAVTPMPQAHVGVSP